MELLTSEELVLRFFPNNKGIYTRDGFIDIFHINGEEIENQPVRILQTEDPKDDVDMPYSLEEAIKELEVAQMYSVLTLYTYGDKEDYEDVIAIKTVHDKWSILDKPYRLF